MPSARVNCPYCSAKLRVSTDGGMSTRAKCRVCKKSFTPTLAIDPPAGSGAPPVGPPPPAAATGPHLWAGDPGLSAPLGAVAAPLVMPPLAEPPPAAVMPSLSEPLPPVGEPVHGAAGKPGGGRRRQKVHDRPANQLRPYEVVLASALILAVIGGLGFLAYQLYDQPPAGPVEAAADGDRVPGPAEPFAAPVATDLTPKPRPKRLAGVWELRADDGRAGRLVLRPDGTLVASSTSGEVQLPDYNGKWFLLAEDGDRFTLEFGRERAALDAYKVNLVLTGPDAFTLTETIKGGMSLRESQRFIRATAARAP